jgi:hypothetical protein
VSHIGRIGKETEMLNRRDLLKMLGVAPAAPSVLDIDICPKKESKPEPEKPKLKKDEVIQVDDLKDLPIPIYDDSVIIKSGDVVMTYEYPIGPCPSLERFVCRVTYLPRDVGRMVEIMGVNCQWRVEWRDGAVLTFWGYLDEFRPCSDIRRGQKRGGADICIFVTHSDSPIYCWRTNSVDSYNVQVVTPGEWKALDDKIVEVGSKRVKVWLGQGTS